MRQRIAHSRAIRKKREASLGGARSGSKSTNVAGPAKCGDSKMDDSQQGLKEAGVWAQIRSLPSQGHKLSVTTVTVSSCGEFIYTTGDDNTTKKWLVASGQVVNSYLGHKDSVWCLALSKTEDFVYTGSRDGTAKRFVESTGELLTTFIGHEGDDPGVRCLTVAHTPAKDILFTGSRDFTVRQWDTESGICTRVLTHHTGIVWNLAASPDGESVFSCSADKSAAQISVGSGQIKQVFEHEDFVWSVAISPDSKYLYTGCRDHVARRWNVASGMVEQDFQGHTDTVRWVSLNPAGNRLLTAGYDVRVKEWDAWTGKALQDFTGHGKAVLCTSASRDGTIFSSSADALVMRFRSAPGISDPEKPALLKETPMTTFTSIPAYKISLIILALVVQTLQIASFALSLKFPWSGFTIGWLQEFLSFMALQVQWIFGLFPSLPVASFQACVIAWTCVFLFLFYFDIYGVLQKCKSKLNEIGLGRVKRSRYKGDNPLEKGDRTATNKAEWQVWETTTWIYFFTDLSAYAVLIIEWLASTLLAIPTVSSLVQILASDSTGQVSKCLAGIILPAFILAFMRLRVTNGSAALVSIARKKYASENRERFIPGAWLLSVGGAAALETLGPFTIVDWQSDLVAGATFVGFSIANNAGKVSLLTLASLNLFFAILLVVNLVSNSSYYSFKMSRLLFALQALQMWNSSISIVVVAQNNPENLTPSLVWYAGLVPVFALAFMFYTRIYFARHARHEGSGAARANAIVPNKEISDEPNEAFPKEESRT